MVHSNSVTRWNSNFALGINYNHYIWTCNLPCYCCIMLLMMVKIKYNLEDQRLNGRCCSELKLMNPANGAYDELGLLHVMKEVLNSMRVRKSSIMKQIAQQSHIICLIFRSSGFVDYERQRLLLPIRHSRSKLRLLRQRWSEMVKWSGFNWAV